jgi:hypothetical protein
MGLSDSANKWLLIAGVLSAYFLYITIQALREKRIAMNVGAFSLPRWVKRQDHPVAYWLMTIFQLFLGLFFGIGTIIIFYKVT